MKILDTDQPLLMQNTVPRFVSGYGSSHIAKGDFEVTRLQLQCYCAIPAQ
jgi:hypothetical protein